VKKALLIGTIFIVAGAIEITLISIINPKEELACLGNVCFDSSQLGFFLVAIGLIFLIVRLLDW
jgi:hypothetical protein